MEEAGRRGGVAFVSLSFRFLFFWVLCFSPFGCHTSPLLYSSWTLVLLLIRYPGFVPVRRAWREKEDTTRIPVSRSFRMRSTNGHAGLDGDVKVGLFELAQEGGQRGKQMGKQEGREKRREVSTRRARVVRFLLFSFSALRPHHRGRSAHIVL